MGEDCLVGLRAVNSPGQVETILGRVHPADRASILETLGIAEVAVGGFAKLTRPFTRGVPDQMCERNSFLPGAEPCRAFS